MAVLKLNPCAILRLGHEAHLDLRSFGRIWFVDPSRPNLPGEDNPPRRIPDKHRAPIAFAPITPPLEPAATFERLEGHRLPRWLGKVMGLDGPPDFLLDEEREGLYARNLDDNGL